LPDLTPEVVKPYLKREEFRPLPAHLEPFPGLADEPGPDRGDGVRNYGQEVPLLGQGRVLKFAGFLALTAKERSPNRRIRPTARKTRPQTRPRSGPKAAVTLPAAKEGETLALRQIEPKQSFTQPPPRYNERLAGQELEAKGIGRPSTYAPIISTLQNRTYVVKIENKFMPLSLGMFVTEFLIKNFPDIMEIRSPP